MSCKYSEYLTGLCIFAGDGIDRHYNENGICTCEDDEDPSLYCEDYEER